MRNPTLQILKEILGEFINVLFGNIWNKVGLSILLMVMAMICFFSPIVINDGEISKPVSFYITGGLLVLISFYLLGKRWKELKEKHDK